MKLKKLWMALLCAACLIGGRKAMASEPLVTMNGTPMLTSGEVMQEIKDQAERSGSSLSDFSSEDRDMLKNGISEEVTAKVYELIAKEWFNQNKDQANAITQELRQQCDDRIRGAYSTRPYSTEEKCIADLLPYNIYISFLKKHFGNEYIPRNPTKEQQTLIDNYKKEYGIKTYEENLNKLVNRILSHK